MCSKVVGGKDKKKKDKQKDTKVKDKKDYSKPPADKMQRGAIVSK